MTLKDFFDILNEENNTMVIIYGIKFQIESPEGPIPHLHFYSPDLNGCIRLDKAEYFKHGNHNDVLPRKILKEFYKWIIVKDDEKTNYEKCCDEWNKSNQFKIVIPSIIPNYLKTK